MKLTMNIFMKLSKYFLNVFFIAFWYVGGPYFIPRNITLQINAPQSVTNVVLYLSMDILWYPKYPSKNNLHHILPLCLVPHMWMVMEKDLFLLFHLAFWNPHKLNFPFFFGITTIGDNHVQPLPHVVWNLKLIIYQCHVFLL